MDLVIIDVLYYVVYNEEKNIFHLIHFSDNLFNYAY